MKDLPHHMKKLNRRVVRSEHREEVSEEAEDFSLFAPPRKQTEKQVKKQAKAQIRKTKSARVPTHLTADEKNKKMNKRVPEFERNNKAKPKTTRPTRKKTPKI